MKPEQCVYERRFAGTVGPQQTDSAAIEHAVQRSQDRSFAEGYAKLFEARLHCSCRCHDRVDQFCGNCIIRCQTDGRLFLSAGVKC